MKVSQLIELLKEYPADIDVVCEWDSGWSNLEQPELQKDKNDNDVLVFDCNEYGTYRQDKEL